MKGRRKPDATRPEGTRGEWPKGPPPDSVRFVHVWGGGPFMTPGCWMAEAIRRPDGSWYFPAFSEVKAWDERWLWTEVEGANVLCWLEHKARQIDTDCVIR